MVLLSFSFIFFMVTYLLSTEFYENHDWKVNQSTAGIWGTANAQTTLAGFFLIIKLRVFNRRTKSTNTIGDIFFRFFCLFWKNLVCAKFLRHLWTDGDIMRNGPHWHKAGWKLWKNCKLIWFINNLLLSYFRRLKYKSHPGWVVCLQRQVV